MIDDAIGLGCQRGTATPSSLAVSKSTLLNPAQRNATNRTPGTWQVFEDFAVHDIIDKYADRQRPIGGEGGFGFQSEFVKMSIQFTRSSGAGKIVA